MWGSTYDIRDLLDASVKLRDGKPLTDMSLNLIEKFALRKVLDKAQGTDIEKRKRAQPDFRYCGNRQSHTQFPPPSSYHLGCRAEPL